MYQIKAYLIFQNIDLFCERYVGLQHLNFWLWFFTIWRGLCIFQKDEDVQEPCIHEVLAREQKDTEGNEQHIYHQNQVTSTSCNSDFDFIVEEDIAGQQNVWLSKLKSQPSDF